MFTKFDKMRYFLCLSLITLTALTGCSTAPEKELAKLTSFSGTVLVREASQGKLQPAVKGIAFQARGAVRTKEDGKAVITFLDNSYLHVEPNSYVEIRDDVVRAHQTSGKIVYSLQKHDTEMLIETPHGVTAVLGTTFLVEVDEASTSVTLEEGKVTVRNKDASSHKDIKPGQKVRIDSSGKISEIEDVDLFTRNAIFHPDDTQLPAINQH